MATLKQELLEQEGPPPSARCRKAASANGHFRLSEVDLEAAEKSELVLELLLGTGGHVDRHRGKRRQHVTCSTSGKLPKRSQGLWESLRPCAHGTKRRPPPYSCPTRVASVPGRASASQGTQTNSIPDSTERLSPHKANLEMGSGSFPSGSGRDLWPTLPLSRQWPALSSAAARLTAHQAYTMRKAPKA